MASLLLDTGTWLARRRNSPLSQRAENRLLAVELEQIFLSVVTLHALRRMNRQGTFSDRELDELLEQLVPSQILELDFETRLLAGSLQGRLEPRLLAATARRSRLTLLAATDEYDKYHIDVVLSMPGRRLSGA
jgi:predicted nucleic acid-binding protein